MRLVYDQQADNHQLFNFEDYLQAGKGVVVPTNCVVYNGHLVMGAGLAKLAVDYFPLLPLHWAVKPLGAAMFAFHQGLKMIRFATKYHFNDKADLGLIEKSAASLLTLVDSMEWALHPTGVFPIYIPQVGCGLGGLDWADDVYPRLDKVFGDDPRFVCTPP